MKDVKDCASTPNNGCDVIPGQFLLHVGQLKYFKMSWFGQKTRVINDLVACWGCPRCEHSSVFCLHAVWAFAHHGFGSANSFLECSGSANTSTAIVHLGNSYDPICRETVRVWNYTRMFFFLPHGFFQLRVEGVKQKRDNSLCPATENVLVQTMSVYVCVPFSCANYLPHKQAAYRPASVTCMAWPA